MYAIDKTFNNFLLLTRDAHCVAAQLSAPVARLAWRAFSSAHAVSASLGSFFFVESARPSAAVFLPDAASCLERI
jgi:hypothetical protein